MTETIMCIFHSAVTCSNHVEAHEEHRKRKHHEAEA
jgi:hypothetical protein